MGCFICTTFSVPTERSCEQNQLSVWRRECCAQSRDRACRKDPGDLAVDATAHLIAGAAAGGRVRHLPGALLVGIGTHALLDAIPHYNYTGWRTLSGILVGDVVLGLTLALLIALRSARPACVLAGAAGGLLPAV